MIQVRNWLLSAVAVAFCLALFTPTTGVIASDAPQAAIVRKCQPGDIKCTIQKYGSKDDVKVAADRCPRNSPNCGGTRPTRNATASV